MEHYPRPLIRPQSDALAHRLHSLLRADGYGFWAIEVQATGRFIGCAGLMTPGFTAPFTPCMDVGWRLAFHAWGHGYATEAARAALAYAFDALGRAEIVSFTVPGNHRSRRVMERLGMTRSDADDFDHPQLPAGHRLCAHVLYRIRPESLSHPRSTPRG